MLDGVKTYPGEVTLAPVTRAMAAMARPSKSTTQQVVASGLRQFEKDCPENSKCGCDFKENLGSEGGEVDY